MRFDDKYLALCCRIQFWLNAHLSGTIHTLLTALQRRTTAAAHSYAHYGPPRIKCGGGSDANQVFLEVFIPIHARACTSDYTYLRVGGEGVVDEHTLSHPS